MKKANLVTEMANCVRRTPKNVIRAVTQIYEAGRAVDFFETAPLDLAEPVLVMCGGILHVRRSAKSSKRRARKASDGA